MKVQLVLAPRAKLRRTGESDYFYPPLGLMYLASYLRSKLSDVEIKITDGFMLGFTKAVDEIKVFKPDVLGVSVTTLAATGAYNLIDEVKATQPKTMVVCGGAHSTAMPAEVLSRSKTDFVVKGEGEITFYNLLTSNEPKQVKGIAYTEKQQIVETPLQPLISNIDEIPFPARDLIDLEKSPGHFLTKRKPETHIISSRGCPYDCVFCSNAVWKLQKPKHRLRSPQNIADELEILMKDYGIREYADQTDEFNVPRKWAMEVCEEMISRGLDITWKAQVRADNLDETLVAKMAESGCWLVFMGIESGNQDTLDGIRKRITLEQTYQACRLFKQYGIKTFGYFMTYNIWEEHGKLLYEDSAKSRNTLIFAEKLIDEGLLDYFSSAFTNPQPGSELYDIALRHDLLPEDVIGQWEKVEPFWILPTRLAGVSEDEWMAIKSYGMRLQAKCVIRHRRINLSTLKLILKLVWQRGLSIVFLELDRISRRLFKKGWFGWLKG